MVVDMVGRCVVGDVVGSNVVLLVMGIQRVVLGDVLENRFVVLGRTVVVVGSASKHPLM